MKLLFHKQEEHTVRYKKRKTPRKQQGPDLFDRLFFSRSGKKARELDEHRQDSTRFEALYPGYLMSGPAEVFHNEVNGGCYLVARLYKKGGKFIRPELKRRN